MLGLKAERGIQGVHILPGPMDPRVREDDGVWGSFWLLVSSFKLKTNPVRLAACSCAGGARPQALKRRQAAELHEAVKPVAFQGVVGVLLVGLAV